MSIIGEMRKARIISLFKSIWQDSFPASLYAVKSCTKYTSSAELFGGDEHDAVMLTPGTYIAIWSDSSNFAEYPHLQSFVQDEILSKADSYEACYDNGREFIIVRLQRHPTW